MRVRDIQSPRRRNFLGLEYFPIAPEWALDARFEPYWPSIDHMLTDDLASFRRRAAAIVPVGHLEGYDFDAWREQRLILLSHFFGTSP